jgi:glycosyltransferase involved in cell wall biosynthesis
MTKRNIVLICTQLEAGGAQRAALRLAKYFRKQGNECENWFLYKKRDVFQDEPNIKIIYPGQIKSIGNLAVLFKDLYLHLKNSKPDVVITFGHNSNIIAQFIALFAGVKNRIASHRNPRWGYMSKSQQVIDSLWARIGIYKTITAVSGSTKQSFSNYPERIFKNIHVIENGLELEAVTVKNKTEAREALNLPKDVFLIGNVGRLSDQKNQRILVEAISQLSDDIHLSIAGEGELRDKLVNYANELNVAHRVHLLGEIEYSMMPIFFTAIDIFAMPSKFEGLSNALIEAMSANLPVICSSIDSQKDVLIMKDGTVAGKLLPVDQSDKWAKAITNLKKDRAMYLELQEKAKIRSEDFTIEKMGSAFLQLI